MLKCRDVSHLASDYIDQQLTWRKRLSLQVHLFICVNCRRFMSQFRLSQRTAASLARKDASTEEVERVLRHVLEAQRQQPPDAE